MCATAPRRRRSTWRGRLVSEAALADVRAANKWHAQHHCTTDDRKSSCRRVASDVFGTTVGTATMQEMRAIATGAITAGADDGNTRATASMSRGTTTAAADDDARASVYRLVGDHSWGP
ncbi:hypothetical protein NFJ02_31g79670 [Pycnococcus provasolii]